MLAPAHPLRFVARQKKGAAARIGRSALAHISYRLPSRNFDVGVRNWDHPENRDASLRRTKAANRAGEGRRCTAARRRNGQKRRCHGGAEARTRPRSSRVRPAGRHTRGPYGDVLVLLVGNGVGDPKGLGR